MGEKKLKMTDLVLMLSISTINAITPPPLQAKPSSNSDSVSTNHITLPGVLTVVGFPSYDFKLLLQ